MISAAEHRKSHVNILGKRMAYVDMGKADGPAVLFLHGNPTSSYLWRNIMPHLADRCRCLAPDLIGMGDSDKLENPGPDRYTFAEHRDHLDAWIDAILSEGKVTLVIHDWGSALGFDWARRHPDRIQGIAYMEGIVTPVTWADWPKAATEVFKGFRSSAGETMVLEQNVFVEQVLPGSILRQLDDEEMAVYRRPFAEPGEDRRPTLTWPRQIPIDGDPKDVNDLVADYAAWMAENELPKLFINADPGAILRGQPREFCRTWKNQREVTVSGVHFIQEDSPDDIGVALDDWHTILS